jgi:hypothetical protein
MLPAARTVFYQFEPLRIITPIFHGCVIPLFALGASEMNYHPNIFFLRHSSPKPAKAGERPDRILRP